MQALALQNMKIIPDKIFMLNMADQVLFERLHRNHEMRARQNAGPVGT